MNHMNILYIFRYYILCLFINTGVFTEEFDHIGNRCSLEFFLVISIYIGTLAVLLHKKQCFNNMRVLASLILVNDLLKYGLLLFFHLIFHLVIYL